MCECIEEQDIVSFLETHGVSGSFFENHRGNDAKVILDEFTQLLMSFQNCEEVVEEEVVEEEVVTREEDELFELITFYLQQGISEEFIMETKTKNGNTQSGERVTISEVRGVLDEMGLDYVEAGSQQPEDFREVHFPENPSVKISLEIKKTKSPTVVFNDTFPTKNIYYVIFYGGNTRNRPQMICTKGDAFSRESRVWADVVRKRINDINDKYARGDNKKNLSGIMRCYIRPTWSANISRFLKK
jgi:hypothetical protein